MESVWLDSERWASSSRPIVRATPHGGAKDRQAKARRPQRVLVQYQQISVAPGEKALVAGRAGRGSRDERPLSREPNHSGEAVWVTRRGCRGDMGPAK